MPDVHGRFGDQVADHKHVSVAEAEAGLSITEVQDAEPDTAVGEPVRLVAAVVALVTALLAWVGVPEFVQLAVQGVVLAAGAEWARRRVKPVR